MVLCSTAHIAITRKNKTESYVKKLEKVPHYKHGQIVPKTP